MPDYELKCPPGSLSELKDSSSTMIFILRGGQVRELKEETQCWCEFPRGDRAGYICAHKPGGKGIPIGFKIERCPVCGRKV